MELVKLGIDNNLLKALGELNYENLTSIQQKTIFQIKSDRDLLCHANEKTGKTTAIILSIIDRLVNKKDNGKIRAVILLPDRQKVLNAYNIACELTKYTNVNIKLINDLSCDKFKKNVDILICTPKDFLKNLYDIELSFVKYFAIDDAHIMCDLGYFEMCLNISELIESDCQNIIFSTNLSNKVEELSKKIQNKPYRIDASFFVEDAFKINQEAYIVDKKEKISILKKIVEDSNKKIIIFCKKKYTTDYIARCLYKNKIFSKIVSTEKSYGSRCACIKQFQEGNVNVLITTDIAVKGIDIQNLELVIMYDVPNVTELYMQRISKFCENSKVIVLCSFEEAEFLNKIENEIQINIKKIENKLQSNVQTACDEKIGFFRQIKQENKPQKEIKKHVKVKNNFQKQTIDKKQNIKLKKETKIYDEFCMDISTPRTAKISDEAAARIRAKVEAKLNERALIKKNFDKNFSKKQNTDTKRVLRKKVRFSKNRTRGRGNRKSINKD